MFPGIYDPAAYGTPLALLQIPAQAKQSIQSKIQDEGCIITRYTQDCRSLSDLKELVSQSDFDLAKETMADVGYICRKCQLVFPMKNACMNHQQTVCYAQSGSSSAIEKSMIKLEQLQFECRACNVKASTVVEYKEHCQSSVHRKAI